MDRKESLKRSVLSAMVYPSAIGLFAISMTIGLMRGVIPAIAPMLSGLNVSLPLITRFTLAASDFTVRFWPHVAGGTLVAVVVSWLADRHFRGVRRLRQGMMLAVPVFGRLYRHYSLSIFLRSFGALVSAGLDASSACSRAGKSSNLATLRSSAEHCADGIAKGIAASTAMSELKGLPEHARSLCAAGEVSGSLGLALGRAADIIDRDIERAIKGILSLLEPAMMAGMGACVGTVALSIMMPIYDVSKALSS